MRAALLLLLAAAPAGAQMYTWTDEKGVEHFSSKPPKDPQAAKKAKEQRPDTRPIVFKKAGAAGKAAPTAPAKPAPQTAQPAQAAPAAAKVELYATSWCPACRQTRAYFESKGVAYTEYDIESDEAAAARFAGYGGNGVPLIVSGESVVRGFSVPALDALLARKGTDP